MSFGTLREDLSLKDVSSMVYLKIKSAAPNSVIQLPERHIVLPGLTFNHPVTIIGTAATTLEIVNGNILIDFRDYCNTIEGGGSNKQQLNKVVIQEVSLVFKMSSLRLRERLDEYEEKVAQLKDEKETV